MSNTDRQMMFDGMPATPLPTHHGYLYACFDTTTGNLKFGMSGTFKGTGKRFAAHRKAAGPNMHPYITRFMPHVAAAERSLIAQTEPWVLAGKEWVYIADVNVAGIIIEAFEKEGATLAETWALRNALVEWLRRLAAPEAQH